MSSNRLWVPVGALSSLVLLILPFESGSSFAADDDGQKLEAITVIAQHLNEARNGIQTQTGASTYVIDEAAIAPGATTISSIRSSCRPRMSPRIHSASSTCAASTTACNIG